MRECREYEVQIRYSHRLGVFTSEVIELQKAEDDLYRAPLVPRYSFFDLGIIQKILAVY